LYFSAKEISRQIGLLVFSMIVASNPGRDTDCSLARQAEVGIVRPLPSPTMEPDGF
jgi:hypothetical protein